MSAKPVTLYAAPNVYKVWTDRIFLARCDYARGGYNGRHLVVVNGCFDLLHAGHLHMLRYASRRWFANGDPMLVVLLNTDESVQRLKGPLRPIVTFNDRANLLASLRFVSAVAGFSDDTPAEALKRLRPDVLVKGAEYAGQTVPGGEHCGEVRFAPRLPCISTTQLEKRIRAGSTGRP